MKYLLLIYLTFYSLCSFGQNKPEIDSLKVLLKHNQINKYQAKLNLDLSKLTTNYNRDSSKIYAKTAEQIAFNINNRNLLSKALLQEGILNYKDRKDDLALLFFSKIDSIYKVDKSILEPYFMSKIYHSEISKFTFTMEGVKQAKVYILQALVLANENKNKKLVNIAKYRLAEWHGFMSQAEFKKEHLDSAKIYINAVLPYYKSKKDYNFLAKSYHTLASIEIESKNISAAERYYKKRLQTIKKSKDSVKIGEAYQSFGSLYLKMKQPNKGLLYLDSASAIFKKSGFRTKKRKKDLLKDYAYLYEAKQDYKRAFTKMYQALLLKDTIYEIENTKQAMKLEKKYQTQKKEHKILLLKAQKNQQRNVFLGALFLTTLAGFFFFFQFRNRQKINKKFKELDIAKSNFFTNISHEFRTPLTLISGPIQQQLNNKNLQQHERSNLLMMQRNVKRLLYLVDQLLAISKLESGSLHLKISNTKIIPFIAVLIDGFSFKAKQKNINLITNIKSTDSETWTDKDAVEKMGTNLLSNAIKYTPKNGTIICNVYLKDDKLVIEVKNSGKGLTEKELKKVFKRFYQIDNQTEGVGIGLALVKELVNLHKGSITVTSTPNEWTEFKIVLPITKTAYKTDEIVLKTVNEEQKLSNQEDTSIAENKELTNLDTEKPILLIVEDNKDVRTYISSIFSDLYSIIQAKNGQEGIDLAIEHVPDIIISDIMMPIKNGISLCNTLKVDERTSHIPIILLTAKAGEENEMEGIKNGADAYITKPFNEELLKLKVEQLIKVRNKLQERYSQELILKPKDLAICDVDEKFLNKVQKFLDANLVESSLSVEDFSKAVGMSRMQLHRKLKVLTGLSATEFIRSQRLKLAADLLKKSDINVSQIGYSVGFNDHAYFSKCFKELFGCSPTAFANKHK